MFLLSFFFFLFALLVSVLFIIRAMCACLSVTVDALCSWREQCVTRGVRADVLEEKCCVQ